MSTTLVSFLGKNTIDRKTGYRTANYRFPDGTGQQTPFFGLALAQTVKPDRLLILGTQGSMWDVLIGFLDPAGTQDEAIWERLMEAAQAGCVDAALLREAQPQVARNLGLPVDLRLIPFGKTEAEQADILRTIADAVPQGRVILDLTHGFRHLAAIGLLSAFFLERTNGLEVAGLYYGALDMTQDGVTPVVRLDGLLAIQRWIDALDRFDQTGDYGLFAPLLVADGVANDKAKCLEDAAFHERTFNLKDAARKIGTFLPVLDAGLPGTGRLFQGHLRGRLAWARSGPLYEHQQRLARLYLDRRDYVRATVLAWESIISRECFNRRLDVDDFSQNGGRKQAEDDLKKCLNDEGDGWSKSPHNRIKALRNALAHGNPPPWKEVRRALGDAERLFKLLDRDFRLVFAA
jgi:CRISPR-associated Csx2 family protein